MSTKNYSFKNFDLSSIPSKIKAPTKRKSKSGTEYMSGDLGRILIQGPRITIPGPEYRENKFNPGKMDFMTIVHYDKENKEHMEWVDFRNKLHDAFAAGLKPLAAKYKIPSNMVDFTDTWVTGVRVRYPKDKETDQPMMDAAPYDAIKCTNYSNFIGLDGVSMPHNELKGMDATGIPLYEYHSIYVGQSKAAVQSRLASFIVEDIAPSSRNNEQMEQLKELAADKAKVEEFKRKKAEAAKKRLEMPPSSTEEEHQSESASKPAAEEKKTTASKPAAAEEKKATASTAKTPAIAAKKPVAKAAEEETDEDTNKATEDFLKNRKFAKATKPVATKTKKVVAADDEEPADD